MNDDEHYWMTVRSAFNLDPNFIHLVGFWLSSHPEAVRSAIDRHRRELDANPYLYVKENGDSQEALVREALGRFLNGRPDCIALIESTSMGLGLVLAGLFGPSEGEILTTEHEHYSAWEAADTMSQRTGMRVKRVRLYEDGDEPTEESIIQRLVEALSSATRVIVLTWVHSSTGVRLPLQRLCTAVKSALESSLEEHPVIIVDATHAVGAFPVSLQEIGCDIVIGSCHKWMMGPRGTAFIWGHERAMGAIRAVVPSFAPGALCRFTGARLPPNILPGERLTPGGFHCFEHRWSVAAAIDFLEAIDFARVVERLEVLCALLRQGLEGMDSVRLVTPRHLAAGFICFEMPGKTSEWVCNALLRRL